MPNSKNQSSVRWKAKTYKKIEVMLSIVDHETVKQYCRRNHVTMANYLYELLIKDMANKGIRLEGTATRDVEAIVNNVSRETQNNVTD